MTDTNLGRDLPEEDAVPDLPVRPVAADLGYGLAAEDVARGYCSAEPEMPGDVRAGVATWPEQKGFLYRGSLGLDR